MDRIQLLTVLERQVHKGELSPSLALAEAYAGGLEHGKAPAGEQQVRSAGELVDHFVGNLLGGAMKAFAPKVRRSDDPAVVFELGEALADVGASTSTPEEKETLRLFWEIFAGRRGAALQRTPDFLAVEDELVGMVRLVHELERLNVALVPQTVEGGTTFEARDS